MSQDRCIISHLPPVVSIHSDSCKASKSYIWKSLEQHLSPETLSPSFRIIHRPHCQQFALENIGNAFQFIISNQDTVNGKTFLATPRARDFLLWFWFIFDYIGVSLLAELSYWRLCCSTTWAHWTSCLVVMGFTGALVVLVVCWFSNHSFAWLVGSQLVKHHSHTLLFFFFGRSCHIFSLHAAFVAFQWISSLTSFLSCVSAVVLLFWFFLWLPTFLIPAKHQLCHFFSSFVGCGNICYQLPVLLVVSATLVPLLAVPLAAFVAGCNRHCRSPPICLHWW